ncbi:MAG: hypothetical protein ACR2JB_19090 [Bryobacteraceae bacterium]
MEWDRTTIARFAYLLTSSDEPPMWKSILATVRALRREAAEILDRNWLSVMDVASSLERWKELDYSQIAKLLRSVTITG